MQGMREYIELMYQVNALWISTKVVRFRCPEANLKVSYSVRRRLIMYIIWARGPVVVVSVLQSQPECLSAGG